MIITKGSRLVTAKDSPLNYSEMNIGIDDFAELLESPEVCSSGDTIDQIKLQSPFYFFGKLKNLDKEINSDNIESYSAIVLDLDETGMSEDELYSLLESKKYAYVGYSSISHMHVDKGKVPKYRVVFPLAEPIPSEETKKYKAIAQRIAADYFGYKKPKDNGGVDHFSWSVGRKFLAPIHMKNFPFWSHSNIDKDQVDPSEFDIINDDISRKATSHKKSAQTADQIKPEAAPRSNKEIENLPDPRNRPFPYGAFNARYPVKGVLDNQLFGVVAYEKGSSETRYTFKEGSSLDGLELVQPFPYACRSWHSTDPLSQFNVFGSYDLVRVHGSDEFGNSFNGDELSLNSYLERRGIMSELRREDSDDLAGDDLLAHAEKYAPVPGDIFDSSFFGEVYKSIVDRDTKVNPKIPTGFDPIDEFLNGGINERSLTLVAGNTRVGKTTWTNQMADNIAMSGERPVLYVSLEMPKRDIVLKSLSWISAMPEDEEDRKVLEAHGAINPDAFTVDEIETEDHSQWSEEKRQHYLDVCDFYNEEIAPNRMTTDDSVRLTSKNVEQELEKNIKKIIEAKDKAPVVFLDYLQFITFGRTENVKDAINEVLKSIKHLIRKYGVTFVVICSLNRTGSKSTRPTLHDLKDSGDIEFTGDLAFILVPNELRRGIDIHIDKNRKGPQTDEHHPITLEYIKEHNYFKEGKK